MLESINRHRSARRPARGHRLRFRPNLHANRHIYPATGHVNAHAFPNPYGYTHPNRHTYPYTHTYPHRYSYSHTHLSSYSHTHSSSYSHTSPTLRPYPPTRAGIRHSGRLLGWYRRVDA